MMWPWISRKAFDTAMAEVERFRAMAAAYAKQANMADALRRDEQWRRLKAEGQLAYVLDRARQARELMLPYVADEPPTMKRKAIPE